MGYDAKDYAILEVLQSTETKALNEQSLFLRSRLSRKQYERERMELLMAHVIEAYVDDANQNGLRVSEPKSEPEKEAPPAKPPKSKRREIGKSIDDDREITRIDKRTYGYFSSSDAWADRLADFYGDVAFDEGDSGSTWTVESIDTGKTYRYKVTVDDDGGLMVEKAGRR